MIWRIMQILEDVDNILSLIQSLLVIQLQLVQETSRKPWMQHVESTNQMLALSYRKMALAARVWL